MATGRKRKQKILSHQSAEDQRARFNKQSTPIEKERKARKPQLRTSSRLARRIIPPRHSWLIQFPFPACLCLSSPFLRPAKRRGAAQWRCTTPSRWSTAAATTTGARPATVPATAAARDIRSFLASSFCLLLPYDCWCCCCRPWPWARA